MIVFFYRFLALKNLLENCSEDLFRSRQSLPQSSPLLESKKIDISSYG
jgi:hypothetical protein